MDCLHIYQTYFKKLHLFQKFKVYLIKLFFLDKIECKLDDIRKKVLNGIKNISAWELDDLLSIK